MVWVNKKFIGIYKEKNVVETIILKLYYDSENGAITKIKYLDELNREHDNIKKIDICKSFRNELISINKRYLGQHLIYLNRGYNTLQYKNIEFYNID